MFKKKRIKIMIGVAALIIIIVALSIYTNMKNQDFIRISGILEADKVDVPALVSGVVDKVFLDEGSSIDKGDKILVINSTQLQIKREQAQSVVKQAEAQLEMAKSGATGAEIRQLQAKVKQAQAGLQGVVSGARPEEIAQAQAKLSSLKGTYDKLDDDYESAQRLFDQDIISQSKLDEAKVTLDNARSAYTSAQEALKLMKKGGSSSQVNIAKLQVVESRAALSTLLQGARPAQLKALQAQIDQAKADLKLVNQLISDSVITSPMKGTISELTSKDGELVTKGSSVASILDLEHLWVKLYVPESKIVYLKLGQSAKIYPEALSEIPFPGKIVYIADQGAFIPPGTKESPDQQVFEVKVLLEKPNLDKIHLRPGMSVDVKINTAEAAKQIAQNKKLKE